MYIDFSRSKNIKLPNANKNISSGTFRYESQQVRIDQKGGKMSFQNNSKSLSSQNQRLENIPVTSRKDQNQKLEEVLKHAGMRKVHGSIHG